MKTHAAKIHDALKRGQSHPTINKLVANARKVDPTHPIVQSGITRDTRLHVVRIALRKIEPKTVQARASELLRAYDAGTSKPELVKMLQVARIEHPDERAFREGYPKESRKSLLKKAAAIPTEVDQGTGLEIPVARHPETKRSFLNVNFDPRAEYVEPHRATGGKSYTPAVKRPRNR